MNGHLVVVALTRGMWELSSLKSEDGFSGIVGGNKISLFLSIATTFSSSARIWSALTLLPRMGEIFLLLRPIAVIAP